MTNPAAAVALLYDSVDLQEADFQIFLEISKGLDSPPTVRGKDVVIPNDPGRWAMTFRDDMLPIELVGIVTGDETLSGAAYAESFAVNRAEVRELFAPDRMPAVLQATTEDGRVLVIEARPLPDSVWTPHPGHDHLSIRLDGYGDWIDVTSEPS